MDGNFSEIAFAVRSTYHIIKGKISDQLVIVQAIILSIKHVVGRRYIRQHTQVKKEKYVILDSSNLIEYNHRVGDQILLRNKAPYKLRTPFIDSY